MKHTYLRQLLEWRVEVDHEWSLTMGALGKGLKKYLPSDLWEQFEETFVGARLEDNWIALSNIMAFLCRVAVEVGDGLGFEYPHDTHERVVAYVEYIRQMEPSRR
jgi:aminoglycoside 6-adenylyltransferase